MALERFYLSLQKKWKQRSICSLLCSRLAHKVDCYIVSADTNNFSRSYSSL